jgi:peptide/nickel transport system permease protein
MSENEQTAQARAEKACHLPDRGVAPEPASRAVVPWLRTLRALLLFAAQRLAFALVVLAAIIYLSFLGLDMAGGADLRDATEPALRRTAAWLRLAVVAGDLGLTNAGSATALPRPVGEVVAERLPRSLGLLGVSLGFATLFGLGLGVLSAYSRRQGSLVVLLATLVGVSVPSFFAAFLLQWAVISLTRRVGRSLLPVGGFGWDRHLLLPAIVLSARPLAQISRIAFVSMRQVLAEDYVRTARSKGLRQGRVVFAHAMRNAAIPILTTVGVSLRYALSSLPVVELYFGWTGVGFDLLKAISQQDDALTVALVGCLGAVFLLSNLILDASYRLIDPRLRGAPSFIRSGDRRGVVDLLRSTAHGLWELVTGNDLVAWLRRSWFARRGSSASREPAREEGQTGVRAGRHRRSWRVAFTNLPLIAGLLLVLPLLIVVLLGPVLAPNDPSRTQGLTNIDGQFSAPPFPPSKTYPWGAA